MDGRERSDKAGAAQTKGAPRLFLSMAAGVLAVARGAFGDVPVNVPSYTNPVINRDFADPSILSDADGYYAYATNSGQNMPVSRSPDLVHWSHLPDGMPVLPQWARPGRTWAPTVRRLEPGQYVAYFTAWDRAADMQVVGVATGTRPTGPFVSPPSASPLIVQADEGGAIDPTCFDEGHGQHYLLWKNDGNSRGKATWIWIQRLSEDGLSLIGTPTPLIRNDQQWEGPVVEAPTLWKHNHRYYLFYSANFYGDARYCMGYAVSDSLLGPYAKPPGGPWVASSESVCGPGGEDIVATSQGETWMVYHTWAKGRPGTYRSMNLARLVWHGEVPALDEPAHQMGVSPTHRALP